MTSPATSTTTLYSKIEDLAQALSFIEDEREANRRSPLNLAAETSRPYHHLEMTASAVLASAKTSVPPSNGTIGFRSFSGEPTAIFYGSLCAGRIACFSCRDGHFSANIQNIREWPPAEPKGSLLRELAENFWPDD